MAAKPQPGGPEATHDDLSPHGSALPRRLTSELLSRVWQQSLPLVQERVARLESSAQAVAEGTLTPESRIQAADLAHKLAGSLGMFGLPEGTEVARAMEHMLEAETAIDPARYATYTTRLRAIISA